MEVGLFLFPTVRADGVFMSSSGQHLVVFVIFVISYDHESGSG